MKDQHHSSRELNEVENLHYYDIDVENRVIYVHAEFGESEESGVDYRMASKLIKNLNYLNKLSDKPIELNMISYGGCWNYGMAMYDAIKKSKSEITCKSWAHSRSMSSIIPQAATTRLISKHCDFMIHYGTYGDEGDFRKVINGIEHSKKLNDVMIDLYVDRCIKGKFAKEKKFSRKELFEFIKEKMDIKVDWWLSAEEAVYYGFMDGII